MMADSEYLAKQKDRNEKGLIRGRLEASRCFFDILKINAPDYVQADLCSFVKRYIRYQVEEQIDDRSYRRESYHRRKFLLKRLKSKYEDFMIALEFPEYAESSRKNLIGGPHQHRSEVEEAILQQFGLLRILMRSTFGADQKEFDILKAVEQHLVPGNLLLRDPLRLLASRELFVKFFEKTDASIMRATLMAQDHAREVGIGQEGDGWEVPPSYDDVDFLPPPSYLCHQE